MNLYKSRCQCLESCTKESLPGEAFCTKHLKFCPRKVPLNGFEPPFEPWRWNTHKSIRTTHNCFSYAFNMLDPRQILKCFKDPNCNAKNPGEDCQGSCDVPFHQPGSVSGWPRFTDKDPKTCPNMIARLLGDNPSFLPSTFEEKCPRQTSKIALIVDEDQDYHFLRQDNTGFFSQKSGAMPVTNLDANGHKIFDVRLAYHYFKRQNNDDDPLNYDKFCGYFCVPRGPKVKIFTKSGGKYRFTKKVKKELSRRSNGA